eukprot:scaffold25659_cov132-Cylindrotheca_fusiformis.AAC.2
MSQNNELVVCCNVKNKTHQIGRQPSCGGYMEGILTTPSSFPANQNPKNHLISLSVVSCCPITMLRKRPTILFFLLCLYVEVVIGLAMPKEAKFKTSLRRRLPQKLLIGYATECSEKVVNAVREGVNVVVWSFMEIQNRNNEEVVIIENSLDFQCIKELIATLDNDGFSDTVHLVSFGGWNGPHLDTSLTAERWYRIWKDHVGDIFHGIDWDLEGHDDLASPTNVFSVECLDQIGFISSLAKEDGYIIGMAPPQSYLDLQSSRFSRSVNLTEPDRPW